MTHKKYGFSGRVKMDLLRTDVDLKSLFHKLGHSLMEIRVRSLNNILSKLEHKLITEHDLVHERYLLIRLLEWFNFPQCPHQQEVLGLILRLIQHPAAVEILVSVGAINFFTEFRKDCDERLTSDIDRVLEGLMTLPTTLPHVVAPCVYHGVPAMTVLQSTSNADISEDSVARITEDSIHTIPHNTLTGSEVSSHYGSYQLPDTAYHTDACPHDNPGMPLVTDKGQVDRSFKVASFVWLPLTYTDRKVLMSTNTSLNSHESYPLRNACEFLSEVVFLDFPAEVFLQRPDIIKSLVSLLSGSDNEPELSRRVVLTLTDLTLAVHNRIRFYRDPAFYSAKHSNFLSSTTSTFSSHSTDQSNLAHYTADPSSDQSNAPYPPVSEVVATRHRGDGQDGDNAEYGFSSVPPLVTTHVPGLSQISDIEDVQSLQLSQLTVPQFSLAILEHSLGKLRSTNDELLNAATVLISAVVELLIESVSPQVWADNSLSAREFCDKMTDIFELFADLLFHHHHRGDNDASTRSSKWPLNSSRSHRYLFVWLSQTLARLLPPLVSIDKAKFVLPEVVVGSLCLVVFDECIGHMYPDVRRSLIGYMKRCEPMKYQLYEDTVAVCQSGYKSCKFLADIDAAVDDEAEKFVALAREALPSLPYHQHLGVIERFLWYISSVCKKRHTFSQHRDVLLQFFSHPVSEIKLATYRVCQRIITESLDVEKAAGVHSTQHRGVAFLLDTSLIYEIVCFGFTHPEVGDLAKSLISHLLANEVMLGAELWYDCVSAITPVLPLLQCFVGEKRHGLGANVLALTTPDESISGETLPRLERLRATLRLMFSTDLKIRSDSLKQIASILTSEPDGHKKLPHFSSLDVSNLSDIFVLDKLRPLHPDPTGLSVFTDEGVRRVYDIFTSATVDPVVKKSALDQLAIMMQDSSLHRVFCENGGLEAIVGVIQASLIKSPDLSSIQLASTGHHFLQPAIAIIYHVIVNDNSRRHDMAHLPGGAIYHSLLRAALLQHKDPGVTHEVSRVLALLLFDEVTSFSHRSVTEHYWSLATRCSNLLSSVECQTKGDNQIYGPPSWSEGSPDTNHISVPMLVSERYRLPFQIAVHHKFSPHAVSMPTDPNRLKSGLAAEMICIAWNVAWHYGMDNLVDDLGSVSQHDNLGSDVSADVTLTPTEILLLCTTHYKCGLVGCLHDATNATSHESVKVALSVLEQYVIQLSSAKITLDVLDDCNWMSPFTRYLTTAPLTNYDELLLTEIIRCASFVVQSSNRVSDQLLQVLYQSDGLVLNILNQSNSLSQFSADEVSLSVKRHLDKEILSLISAVTSITSAHYGKRRDVKETRGDIVYVLMLRLNMSEVPHFYNLASLEGTLQCLRHVTARAGWSREISRDTSDSLTTQLLHSLLQVLSAFHIGRGGTPMSYMGRGVTRAAAVCLHHLSYEMSLYAEDENWCHNWLYSHQTTYDIAQPELGWLINLWLYRDPEVRLAGVGLAAALASTPAGRAMMTANFSHVPGGLWGSSISVMLDHSECSLVRYQAVLLLVNLTSVDFTTTHNDNVGPIVMETQYKVSLKGLPAILALLDYTHFYAELSVMLRSFYPQCTIHPVIVANQRNDVMSSLDSQVTLTTLDTDRQCMTQPGTAHTPTPTPRPQVFTSTPTEQTTTSRTTQQNHAVQSTNTESTADFTPRQRDGSSVSSAALYETVATPALLAATLQLVRNLVCLADKQVIHDLQTHNLLPIVRSLLDPRLLDQYRDEPTSSSHNLQYELAYTDVTQLYTSIMRLTTVCAVSDSDVRRDVTRDNSFLSAVVDVIGDGVKDHNEAADAYNKLVRASFDCLSSLMRDVAHNSCPGLHKIICSKWPQISECIAACVTRQTPPRDDDLCLSAVTFLTIAISRDSTTKTGDLAGDLATALDSRTHATDIAPGSNVCKPLIDRYEALLMRPAVVANQRERVVVSGGLRALLAVSSSAKRTALDVGLTERLIEHVQHSVNSLNLDCAMRSTNAKEVSEIVSTLAVLHSLLYKYHDAKVAAQHSDLGVLCHRLWALALSNDPLMTSLLSLLLAFSARCPAAASSLAYTSSMCDVTTTTIKPVLTNNSIIHLVIKLCQATVTNRKLVKLAFHLLATLAFTSEARSVLYKSNFLNEFSNLKPWQAAKSRGVAMREGLWLGLLVNLSFCTDGQAMILKVKDSIKLLLEYAKANNSATQQLATLTLRNLCFHAANKPKLLANDDVVPTFLGLLETGSKRSKVIASSALWAVVHNNQKAKVVLKNANVVMKLRAVIGKMRGDGIHGDIRGDNDKQLLLALSAVVATVTDQV